MAKTSSIEKNNRRRRLTALDAPARLALKAVIMDKSKSLEERFKAQLKLDKMRKNGAKTRIRNRCELTGRARGYYRFLKMSRICLRESASAGELPGFRKASW